MNIHVEDSIEALHQQSIIESKIRRRAINIYFTQSEDQNLQLKNLHYVHVYLSFFVLKDW